MKLVSAPVGSSQVKTEPCPKRTKRIVPLPIKVFSGRSGQRQSRSCGKHVQILCCTCNTGFVRASRGGFLFVLFSPRWAYVYTYMSMKIRTLDDWELLQEYCIFRSEDAFARMVGRHLNWVYSAARRQVRDLPIGGRCRPIVICAPSAKSRGSALRHERCRLAFPHDSFRHQR